MQGKGIMSMALVAITPGDLADRISILEIKREKSYCDPEELYELQREWHSLGGARRYIDDLKQINLDGWDVVQRIYEMFEDDEDSTGVDKNYCYNVCRNAHFINKRRVNLKNVINKVMGVERKEVKTWSNSTT